MFNHTAKLGNHIFSAVSRPAQQPTTVPIERLEKTWHCPADGWNWPSVQCRGQESKKLYIHPPYVFILLFITKHWEKTFFPTLHCLFYISENGGTRWLSWFRHCATSQKVTGSIPEAVIRIFHWHNPSGRTMALGSTQPLTEMSARNISWGVKAAGA